MKIKISIKLKRIIIKIIIKRDLQKNVISGTIPEWTLPSLTYLFDFYYSFFYLKKLIL